MTIRSDGAATGDAAAAARRLARALAVLVVLVAAIVASSRIVLRLPGIPYNVSALFLDRASPLALSFFALGVLWTGAGAMLVGRLVTSSRRPYLMLPLALIVVSLVSKMLVSRGVTYESLDDILGTNNLFGLVVSGNVWGSSWRDLFVRLGPDAIDFVERRVRYTALYSLPTICAVLALMAVRDSDQTSDRLATSRRAPTRFTSTLATLGVAALWIWLCGHIVLTWAATDNLTELIADVGPLGVPGPPYLLALMLVLGLNAAVLLKGCQSIRWAVSGVTLLAAAVPATWELLVAGLDQHVSKYGVEFPAQQFLLGPDRQHALTPAVLFARWSALYVGVIVAIAAGAWLSAEIVGAVRAISARRAAAA